MLDVLASFQCPSVAQALLRWASDAPMLLKLACGLLAPAAVLVSLMPYVSAPLKLPAKPASSVRLRQASDPGVPVIGSDASAIPAVL